MKFVAKLALVASVGLALAGCNDKAKQDLLKCQEEGQKITAELTTVKAELDAAKVAATDLQTKFDTLTQERDALLAKVAEFEAAAAAAAEADAAKPAPKPAAKKPAEPAKPAPITTSTGVKAPTVAPKAKGKFQ